METIAVLGTGGVGQTLGTKLVALGHSVVMGSRTADNPKALEWKSKTGNLAQTGTYVEAATAAARFLVLCTKGAVAVEVLQQIPEKALRGKILVDLTNPLDDTAGFPFPLFTSADQSLAELIQATNPTLQVVKTLNTLWAGLMVNPQMVNHGQHQVFLSGNHPEAKAAVQHRLLEPMGWQSDFIMDLGNLSTARGTEAWLPLWMRLYQVIGNGAFNLQIVKNPTPPPA